MFFSRVVNKALYQILSNTSGLTAVVGQRIYRGYRFPEGVNLPACLFYMEQNAWDGPVINTPAEHLTAATMRFVVRLDDVGDSDGRIAPAAMAQLEALAGTIVDVDGYQITFTAVGEVPITSSYEGATQYQRLGAIYQVSVTK